MTPDPRIQMLDATHMPQMSARAALREILVAAADVHACKVLLHEDGSCLIEVTRRTPAEPRFRPVNVAAVLARHGAGLGDLAALAADLLGDQTDLRRCREGDRSEDLGCLCQDLRGLFARWQVCAAGQDPSGQGRRLLVFGLVRPAADLLPAA